MSLSGECLNRGNAIPKRHEACPRIACPRMFLSGVSNGERRDHCLAGQEGFEPTTCGFGDRRSSRWSYCPKKPLNKRRKPIATLHHEDSLLKTTPAICSPPDKGELEGVIQQSCAGLPCAGTKQRGVVKQHTFMPNAWQESRLLGFLMRRMLPAKLAELLQLKPVRYRLLILRC